MKILLVGDSFAANWNDSKFDNQAWWQELSQEHEVHNRAQPGCGEYKILKQICNSDLDQYDFVIVSHTSPYRIHTEQNPFHCSGSHINSDLIYNDVINSKDSKEKKHIVYFFENVFDLDYAQFIHNLIKKEIAKILESKKSLHISFFENFTNEYINSEEINFYDLWKDNSGPVNHLSPLGNQKVFLEIKKRIPL
jgi:hypothetical protein